MALNVTEYALQSSADDTGTTDFVMSAITTVSNSLLVMLIAGIDAGSGLPFINKLTPAGGGLGFNPELDFDGTAYGYGAKVYTAPVTVGGSTVFTIDPDDRGMAKMRVKCWCIENTNAGDPVGGLAEAVAAGNDGAQSTTLNATPATDSLVISARYALMNNGQATATEGAGCTKLDDVSRTDYDALAIQTRIGSASTSVAWADVNTGAGSIAENILIGLEIKAAAGGSVGATTAWLVG